MKVIFALVFAVTFSCIMAKAYNYDDEDRSVFLPDSVEQWRPGDQEDLTVELPADSYEDSAYEYCNSWLMKYSMICKERWTTEKDKFVLRIGMKNFTDEDYFMNYKYYTVRRCRDDICSDVIKKDRQEELWTVTGVWD